MKNNWGANEEWVGGHRISRGFDFTWLGKDRVNYFKWADGEEYDSDGGKIFKIRIKSIKVRVIRE